MPALLPIGSAPVSGFVPGRGLASLIMIGLCVLWSMAGVVARQVESAQSYEMAFWRSGVCCATLFIWLAVTQRKNPMRMVRDMGLSGLYSGVCWCAMFTCFMLAVKLTTVANTLLAISLSPLLAALLARLMLGIRIAAVTWLCIGLAGIGMWWMFRQGLSGDGLWGVLIALGIPIASSINLIILRKSRERINMVPAVMLGGLFSAGLMLLVMFPSTATVSDIAWMSFLGVFQLALPCTLLVWLTKYLPPQDIALLALTEVIFGTLWAWLWGNEAVPLATLQGGLLIIGALVLNTFNRDAAR